MCRDNDTNVNDIEVDDVNGVINIFVEDEDDARRKLLTDDVLTVDASIIKLHKGERNVLLMDRPVSNNRVFNPDRYHEAHESNQEVRRNVEYGTSIWAETTSKLTASRVTPDEHFAEHLDYLPRWSAGGLAYDANRRHTFYILTVIHPLERLVNMDLTQNGKYELIKVTFFARFLQDGSPRSVRLGQTAIGCFALDSRDHSKTDVLAIKIDDIMSLGDVCEFQHIGRQKISSAVLPTTLPELGTEIWKQSRNFAAVKKGLVMQANRSFNRKTKDFHSGMLAVQDLEFKAGCSGSPLYSFASAGAGCLQMHGLTHSAMKPLTSNCKAYVLAVDARTNLDKLNALFPLKLEFCYQNSFDCSQNGSQTRVTGRSRDTGYGTANSVDARFFAEQVSSSSASRESN